MISTYINCVTYCFAFPNCYSFMVWFWGILTHVWMEGNKKKVPFFYTAYTMTKDWQHQKHHIAHHFTKQISFWQSQYIPNVNKLEFTHTDLQPLLWLQNHTGCLSRRIRVPTGRFLAGNRWLGSLSFFSHPTCLCTWKKWKEREQPKIP